MILFQSVHNSRFDCIEKLLPCTIHKQDYNQCQDQRVSTVQRESV